MAFNTIHGCPFCLIFSTHINAHSIITSLKALGVPVEKIYLIKDKNYPSLAAEFLNKQINIWELDIRVDIDLPKIIHQRLGNTDLKVLFFTAEQFHRAMNAAYLRGETADMRFFLGSRKYLDVILDRLMLYRFIEENGLAPVPRTLPGTRGFDAFMGHKIVIRPRVSWQSTTSRHNVAIISSEQEHYKIINEYKKTGLAPDDWCYQEVLSTDAIHNVSVCGWFDAHHQHVICTRKVLQHPEFCGNGDVITRIAPPGRIMEQTAAILNALEYEGPFEFEWIFDNHANVYKVLEINPRFWMQHGLVNEIYGHAVVGRYLGFENEAKIPCATTRPDIRTWVNPLYALYRALKGDFRGLKYYFSAQTISPITLSQALSYAPSHYRAKRLL